MSKSSGEFLTVSLLEEKGYDPLVYRLFCLGSHYRKSLVFSYDALDNAAQAYTKLVARIAALDGSDGAIDEEELRRLAVAPVVPCVVGFAESVFRIPCSFFGISKIVNVGDRGDSERALFLGKSTENSGRDGGKYERHADYNRDDAAYRSSSVFHFVSSFF